MQGVNNNIKAGTCPHGLAPGACPVCSMSGGGVRKSDRNVTRPGEMSYHECVMEWNMMQARAKAQKNHEAVLQHRIANLEQFELAMTKVAEGIKQFTQLMSKSFLTKPIAFIMKNIVLPIVNLIQNLPRFVANFNIKTFLPEISDKLAAIYGEAKAFINKKLEELKKAVKSGLESLFKIFKKNNTDDEDTKIDDDKKIFNLKTILHKLKEKLKRKKDKKDANGTENQQ